MKGRMCACRPTPRSCASGPTRAGHLRLILGSVTTQHPQDGSRGERDPAVPPDACPRPCDMRSRRWEIHIGGAHGTERKKLFFLLNSARKHCDPIVVRGGWYAGRGNDRVSHEVCRLARRCPPLDHFGTRRELRRACRPAAPAPKKSICFPSVIGCSVLVVGMCHPAQKPH